MLGYQDNSFECRLCFGGVGNLCLSNLCLPTASGSKALSLDRENIDIPMEILQKNCSHL